MEVGIKFYLLATVLRSTVMMMLFCVVCVWDKKYTTSKKNINRTLILVRWSTVIEPSKTTHCSFVRYLRIIKSIVAASIQVVVAEAQDTIPTTSHSKLSLSSPENKAHVDVGNM